VSNYNTKDVVQQFLDEPQDVFSVDNIEAFITAHNLGEHKRGTILAVLSRQNAEGNVERIKNGLYRKPQRPVNPLYMDMSGVSDGPPPESAPGPIAMDLNGRRVYVGVSD
jgi:hypothetical protein